MKFFRLDLLTLLISLFILNSCKNQDSLGLNVNAPGSSGVIGAAFVDTSTIFVNTALEDTVVTSGSLPKNPLAYFTDPTFGVSVSDLATDLNLPGSASYAPPNGTITIDSARLVMQYADGFYGDSIESVYKVNVFQLKEQFNTTTAYYNTKKWSYNSNNLLGSLTFNARTHDSIKIYNIVKGGPDTLIKVPPQIRIPIDPAFINSILFSASSITLASNAIFTNLVKGLYITLDQNKTTGAGGTFMMNPADSLTIYYKANNGGTIDTGVVSLPITNMAAAITHAYSTTIKTELADTLPKSMMYLQGLAGLRAKIKFPHLLANLRANLMKKDSDIVLNRAELVVTAVPGSGIPYPPVPRISMYRLDIARQRGPLQDATTTDPRSGGVVVFGGFYNSTSQSYHFIVTAFLQDLLLGNTLDYGTYIGPVDLTASTATTVAYLPTAQVASRTVAGGGANKSLPYSIKLNIIYTKIARK
ncbi:MAG TPA: DUF4270 family protein [Mucilaginibacter sp.]|jgi:hypothetical protein